jgi:hypothetical protein
MLLHQEGNSADKNHSVGKMRSCDSSESLAVQRVHATCFSQNTHHRFNFDGATSLSD